MIKRAILSSIAATLTLFAAGPVGAATWFNTGDSHVTSVTCTANPSDQFYGYCTIAVNGAIQGSTPCASSLAKGLYLLPLNVVGADHIFALAHSALQSGKPVSGYGSGNCTNGREVIDIFSGLP